MSAVSLVHENVSRFDQRTRLICSSMSRVDVPIRLRRAIVQNDPVLFKRILKNNHSYLQNPDFSNKSNTSLHLAAQNGCVEIAVPTLSHFCCPKYLTMDRNI